MGKKKELNKYLNWAGLAALLYMGAEWLGSRVSSKIKFGSPKLKITKTTWTGLDVEITQPVTNNLPVSFPIDSFQGEVLYGNNKISSLMLTNQIIVEANNTSELKINAHLNFENLVSNVAQLVSSGQFLQSIYLKGFVASSGVIYPFKEKFVLI